MNLACQGHTMAIAMPMRYETTYRKAGCYDADCTVGLGTFFQDDEMWLRITHGSDILEVANDQHAARKYTAWARKLHGLDDAT